MDFNDRSSWVLCDDEDEWPECNPLSHKIAMVVASATATAVATALVNVGARAVQNWLNSKEEQWVYVEEDEEYEDEDEDLV